MRISDWSSDVCSSDLYLDADRALDAGGEHVDAIADRRYEEVGQARHLHGGVQLLFPLLHGPAGAPFALRLAGARGLEHLQRRRRRTVLTPPGIAQHVLALWPALAHAFALLHRLPPCAAPERVPSPCPVLTGPLLSRRP